MDARAIEPSTDKRTPREALGHPDLVHQRKSYATPRLTRWGTLPHVTQVIVGSILPPT
jgi:hypothetical protein